MVTKIIHAHYQIMKVNNTQSNLGGGQWGIKLPIHRKRDGDERRQMLTAVFSDGIMRGFFFLFILKEKKR